MAKYVPENISNLNPSSESFKNALISNLEDIGQAVNNIDNDNVKPGASINWNKIDFRGSPFVRTDLFKSGTGSPEGAVIGRVGAIYQRTDGGANTTLYVKESGTGNTGWVAK